MQVKPLICDEFVSLYSTYKTNFELIIEVLSYGLYGVDIGTDGFPRLLLLFSLVINTSRLVSLLSLLMSLFMVFLRLTEEVTVAFKNILLVEF